MYSFAGSVVSLGALLLRSHVASSWKTRVLRSVGCSAKADSKNCEPFV